MNWKVILAVGAILFCNTVIAKTTNSKAAASKGTIQLRAGRGRGLMDDKYWKLPNATEVKMTRRAAGQGYDGIRPDPAAVSF